MLGLGNSIISGAALEDPFTIDKVGGLQLWLQNGEGVTVEQWNDSSGNSNHAAQTDSSKQGAVEDGGIDFNQSSNHYDFTSTVTTATFTLFVAMEPDGGGSMSFLGHGGGTDFVRINQSADNEFRMKRDSAFDLNVSHSTDFTYEGRGGVERFIVMIRQESDNTVTIGVNNDLDNFALANSTGEAMDFSILGGQSTGGANAFDGTIYEVAIYNELLSVSDATLVRENIASRVGITL